MRWEEVPGILIAEAEDDLRATGEVAPGFAAFAGEEALLVAFLRPFEPGEHLDALVEVAALAVPLGADRLALTVAGRAWRLDEPAPQRVPGAGDPRERVLAFHAVDASEALTTRAETRGWRFELADEAVTWGAQLPGEAEGPVVDALTALAEETFEADIEQLRRQVARCLDLGHELVLAPEGQRRLGLADPVALSSARGLHPVTPPWACTE